MRPDEEPCPHCPDGHRDPNNTPWAVWVGEHRDRDGEPVHLVVARTNGKGHVAVSDARWLSDLIHKYRGVSGPAGAARTEETT